MLLEDTFGTLLWRMQLDGSSDLVEKLHLIGIHVLGSSSVPYLCIGEEPKRRRFLLFEEEVVEFHEYSGSVLLVRDPELAFQIRHIAAGEQVYGYI